MEILGVNLELLNHDAVKIKNRMTIYIDPFGIAKGDAADLILISHEHFDHCSVADIRKIMTKNTIIVASKQCKEQLDQLAHSVKEIRYMDPNDSIKISDVVIDTVPAYNVDKFREPGKVFHPKEDKKLGFVLTINRRKIYHTGDTDLIPEMKNLQNKIDIAFVPISGTYVMTAEEAAEAVRLIRPKVAIPMHYKAIVGKKEDAERFKSLVKSDVQILI